MTQTPVGHPDYNPFDPFGFNEPEPEKKEPRKLNWIQRFFLKIAIHIFIAMANRAVIQIRQQQHRRKHFKRVIKQGFFGEYTEWHER